jgi:hypothetical protein
MSLFKWFVPLPDEKQQGRFTDLRSDMILATVQRLEIRIRERFPDSGLLKVCIEFRNLAEELQGLAQRLGPPIWPVRVVAFVAAFLLLGLVMWAFGQLVSHFTFNSEGIHDLLQSTESAINELIFLGLALFFLTSLETRLKRRSALRALHRLRSIAHVVDMHQLTKDPAHVLGKISETEASPARTLTRQELTRYLDYSSEMLALNAKIAALFAQNIDDPVVLNAVNDLEQLAQGLSGKIWQKIMILDLADQD